MVVNMPRQCNNVAMPITDPAAKKWELDLAERVGRAVAARRKALGMTAMDVAAKTASMSYPITRQAVAKIENNNRAGKVDVAELIVLAAALDISPLQLLYPDLVDGPVEVHPGKEITSLQAADWFTGNEILMPDNFKSQPSPYTVDYFEGIAPLHRAFDVGKARDLVITLLTNPAWDMGPGPNEDLFRKAVADLSRAKSDARLEGLIVEDSHDA